MTRFFAIIFLLFPLFIQAQEIKPFTARAYWLELQDNSYQNILAKQKDGTTLTTEEEKYLNFYDKHLEDYYGQLSKHEKELFSTFKSQWDEEARLQGPDVSNEDLETNALGVLPGKKYRLYNGLFGFVYGLALIPVLDVESSGLQIGLPFLLAGGSLLLPIINKQKYADMTYNSVLLSRHGKFYGLIDGAALSLLMFGTESEAAEKAAFGMAIAGSIAMGEIGFQLGKKKAWTEGQISGYTHYAAVGVLFGLGMYGSFAGDFNPRAFGGSILVSQTAGYLLGNNLYKKYAYTRGDILASGSFTAYSTLLGIGLIGQVDSYEDQRKLLLPTSFLLAGSILSHSLTKNLNLTASEGWKIGYSSLAGGLLGLGVAVLINSDEPTLYFILPAAGGLIGWGAMTKAISKKKLAPTSRRNNKRVPSLSYSIQPQNYSYNRKTPFEKLSPDNPAKAVVNIKVTF